MLKCAHAGVNSSVKVSVRRLVGSCPVCANRFTDFWVSQFPSLDCSIPVLCVDFAAAAEGGGQESNRFIFDEDEFGEQGKECYVV